MPRLNFGTHANPVYVEEEEDDDVEIIQADIELGGVQPRRNPRQPRNDSSSGSQPNRQSYNDDDISFMFQDVAEAEAELERDIIEIMDDDDDDDELLPQNQWRTYRRNGPVSSTAVLVQSIPWEGRTLHVGDTVEVTGFISQRYIRISKITQDYTGVMLRGVQYVHMEDMQGMLPWSENKHNNEVCAIYQVDLDDSRPLVEQAAVEISLHTVIGILKLRNSNALWPIHASGHPDELVCRWKYIQYFPCGRVREKHLECYSLYKDLEAALIRNDETDSDPDCVVRCDILSNTWAGHPRVRGGSYIPSRRDFRDPTDFISEANNLDGTKERLPGQKYTFFDAFCGAGGASRGAKRAGLHLKYAVDAWDRACDSYQANFRQVTLFRMKVDEWIRTYTSPEQPDEFHCDILHLSPPCQVFSPAHTINCHDKDEANFAALFACETIIDKVRPRIFTLEQTFGLLHRHWRPVFYHLIASFTRCGYSVRWKYVFLPQWGLPARRKRLIMIGAAPGEILPTFPPPTHSDQPPGRTDGLPPLVTVRQAMSKLNPQRDDPLHRPMEMKRKNMPQWDTDSILTRCVTTSGGQNYHYSGRRCFTHREFALLQGFPTYHEFVGSFRIRQIGNAFPPCTAKVLYRHIEKSLLKADRIQVDEEGDLVLAEAMAVEIADEGNFGGFDLSGAGEVGADSDDEFAAIERALELSRQEYRADMQRREEEQEEEVLQRRRDMSVVCLLDSPERPKKRRTLGVEDSDDWRKMLEADDDVDVDEDNDCVFLDAVPPSLVETQHTYRQSQSSRYPNLVEPYNGHVTSRATPSPLSLSYSSMLDPFATDFDQRAYLEYRARYRDTSMSTRSSISTATPLPSASSQSLDWIIDLI